MFNFRFVRTAIIPFICLIILFSASVAVSADETDESLPESDNCNQSLIDTTDEINIDIPEESYSDDMQKDETNDDTVENSNSIPEENTNEDEIISSNETVSSYECDDPVESISDDKLDETDYYFVYKTISTNGICKTNIIASTDNYQNNFTALDELTYGYFSSLISDVAYGQCSYASVEIPVYNLQLDKSIWTAEDLNLASLIENDAISDEAVTAIMNKVTCNLNKVIPTLLVNYPFELYWFDKTAPVSSGVSDINVYYDETIGDYVITVSGSVFYYFTVCNDCLDNRYDDAYHVSEHAVELANNAAAQAQTIVDNYSSLSDIEKLEKYKDEICSLTSYDRGRVGSTEYGLPWSLINVFDSYDYSESLCEGYAKAYKYLVQRTVFSSDDVSCILVSGTMSSGDKSEQHMWNIVSLGDGKNYLVDVTNCDQGAVGADDKLFMKDPSFSDSKYKYTYFCLGKPVTYEYNETTIMLYGDDALVLTCSNDSWVSYKASSFSGGSGTEEDPYLISTAEELALLAYLVNSSIDNYSCLNYKIINDIDLSGHYWNPIGISDAENYSFNGCVNGDQHTVSGLTISNDKTDVLHFGLFGYVDNGHIRGIRLDDADIYVSSNTWISGFMTNGSPYVGGLVGACRESVISDCHLENLNIVLYSSSYGYLGGVAGCVYDSCSISNCSVTGILNGNSKTAIYTGGVAGCIHVLKNKVFPTVQFSYCSFTGTLYSYGSDGLIGDYGYPIGCGGLIGYNYWTNLVVSDCYSDNYINCNKETTVGGLIGFINNTDYGEGFQCYNTFCISKYNGEFISMFGGGTPRGRVNCQTDSPLILKGVGYYDGNVFRIIKNVRAFGRYSFTNSLIDYDMLSNSVPDVFFVDNNYSSSTWEQGEYIYPILNIGDFLFDDFKDGNNYGVFVLNPSDSTAYVGDEAEFSVEVPQDLKVVRYVWEYRVSSESVWYPLASICTGGDTNTIKVPVFSILLDSYQIRCTVILENGTKYFSDYATLNAFKHISVEVLDDGTVYVYGTGEVSRDDLVGTLAFEAEKVVFGEGITGIQDATFNEKYSNLKEVVFPNSLKTIGDYAFYDCVKIENVTFGNSLESIGDYAFAIVDLLFLFLFQRA